MASQAWSTCRLRSVRLAAASGSGAAAEAYHRTGSTSWKASSSYRTTVSAPSNMPGLSATEPHALILAAAPRCSAHPGPRPFGAGLRRPKSLPATLWAASSVTYSTSRPARNGLGPLNYLLSHLPRVAQRCDVRLGRLIEEEATHRHGLLELAPADVGLVEEVLHDLERDAGLMAVEERDVGARIVRGAEENALQLGEGIGGERRELAHLVELIEEAQLARFAEIREHRLRGAAA